MSCFYVKKYASRTNVHYLRSKIVGNKNIDDVADALAEVSTVSAQDVYAVLIKLGKVLHNFLANGNSVKLEGLGTFYLALKSAGKASADALTSDDIKAVRVRFIPERKENSSGASTRAMVDTKKIEWIEWGAETAASSTGGGSSTPANPQSPSTDTTPTVTDLSLGGKTLGASSSGDFAAGQVAVVLTGTNLANASDVKLVIGRPGTEYAVTVTDKTATSVTGTITLDSALSDPTPIKATIGGTEVYSWTSPFDPYGE